MPFAAAASVAKPTTHPTAARARDSVRTTARAVERAMVASPRHRAKVVRAGLPLRMDQRMKFGWDWWRREDSVEEAAVRKAVGWVVCERAWRRDFCSLEERLSCRGERSAM
jgi:hypothetical protein